MKTIKTHLTADSSVARTRTNKRDSDYLRFRPYHAFTSQHPRTNRWTIVQRIAVIVGFLALLIFSGKFLLFVIT